MEDLYRDNILQEAQFAWQSDFNNPRHLWSLTVHLDGLKGDNRITVKEREPDRFVFHAMDDNFFMERNGDALENFQMTMLGFVRLASDQYRLQRGEPVRGLLWRDLPCDMTGVEGGDLCYIAEQMTGENQLSWLTPLCYRCGFFCKNHKLPGKIKFDIEFRDEIDGQAHGNLWYEE